MRVNPNSISNFCTVFKHIEEIAGINYYAKENEKEVSMVILIPESLHEEVNMLKAFAELNYFVLLQAIINFRTGRPLLKIVARRMFAPIWSARRHPIYRLIEITDEEIL
ncbi:8076_t:CDS:2 [Diversispora eburnea]|uniref:8076_t:CDS:1 n=1 Tax=Diversispora eburnea TaxID=1213867 RepID=A0A9N8WKL3_9GLOM|nr:8076_t:CDS:2 [Diversispora eburnea]